jgi:hypothetical protein
MGFDVNDRVRLRANIIEHPSGDAPGGVCGSRGDIVIVRRVDAGLTYPYAVSHEDRTDGNTFGVAEDEIEIAQEAAEQKGGAACA